MAIEELYRLERSLEKALNAVPPDYATAAGIIERIVTIPLAGQVFYLPELLENLADCYANMGRFDDAIGAMKRALAAGWEGCPDGRHRIAEFLLRAGRADEAHALYAMIKTDNPEDVWLYNAAGLEYRAIGDHQRALQWLSEGLELCLKSGDPEHLAEQLFELREESLAALGCGSDALQERAKQYLTAKRKRSSAGKSGLDVGIGDLQDRMRTYNVDTSVAVAWFPASEFPVAIDKWPFLPEMWDANTYEEYCRQVQRQLITFRKFGIKPNLVPIQVDEFIQWSKLEGLEPGTREARARYAAVLALNGKAISWPPDRNDPCWCGSGRKYKRCCGTVSAV